MAVTTFEQIKMLSKILDSIHDCHENVVKLQSEFYKSEYYNSTYNDDYGYTDAQANLNDALDDAEGALVRIYASLRECFVECMEEGVGIKANGDSSNP